RAATTPGRCHRNRLAAAARECPAWGLPRFGSRPAAKPIEWRGRRTTDPAGGARERIDPGSRPHSDSPPNPARPVPRPSPATRGPEPEAGDKEGRAVGVSCPQRSRAAARGGLRARRPPPLASEPPRKGRRARPGADRATARTPGGPFLPAEPPGERTGREE